MVLDTDRIRSDVRDVPVENKPSHRAKAADYVTREDQQAVNFSEGRQITLSQAAIDDFKARGATDEDIRVISRAMAVDKPMWEALKVREKLEKEGRNIKTLEHAQLFGMENVWDTLVRVTDAYFGKLGSLDANNYTADAEIAEKGTWTHIDPAPNQKYHVYSDAQTITYSLENVMGVLKEVIKIGGQDDRSYKGIAASRIYKQFIISYIMKNDPASTDPNAAERKYHELQAEIQRGITPQILIDFEIEFREKIEEMSKLSEAISKLTKGNFMDLDEFKDTPGKKGSGRIIWYLSLQKQIQKLQDFEVAGLRFANQSPENNSINKIIFEQWTANREVNPNWFNDVNPQNMETVIQMAANYAGGEFQLGGSHQLYELKDGVAKESIMKVHLENLYLLMLEKARALMWFQGPDAPINTLEYLRIAETQFSKISFFEFLLYDYEKYRQRRLENGRQEIDKRYSDFLIVAILTFLDAEKNFNTGIESRNASTDEENFGEFIKKFLRSGSLFTSNRWLRFFRTLSVKEMGRFLDEEKEGMGGILMEKWGSTDGRLGQSISDVASLYRYIVELSDGKWNIKRHVDATIEEDDFDDIISQGIWEQDDHIGLLKWLKQRSEQGNNQEKWKRRYERYKADLEKFRKRFKSDANRQAFEAKYRRWIDVEKGLGKTPGASAVKDIEDLYEIINHIREDIQKEQNFFFKMLGSEIILSDIEEDELKIEEEKFKLSEGERGLPEEEKLRLIDEREKERIFRPITGVKQSEYANYNTREKRAQAIYHFLAILTEKYLQMELNVDADKSVAKALKYFKDNNISILDALVRELTGEDALENQRVLILSLSKRAGDEGKGEKAEKDKFENDLKRLANNLAQQRDPGLKPLDVGEFIQSLFNLKNNYNQQKDINIYSQIGVVSKGELAGALYESIEEFMKQYRYKGLLDPLEVGWAMEGGRQAPAAMILNIHNNTNPTGGVPFTRILSNQEMYTINNQTVRQAGLKETASLLRRGPNIWNRIWMDAVYEDARNEGSKWHEVIYFGEFVERSLYRRRKRLVTGNFAELTSSIAFTRAFNAYIEAYKLQYSMKPEEWEVFNPGEVFLGYAVGSPFVNEAGIEKFLKTRNSLSNMLMGGRYTFPSKRLTRDWMMDKIDTKKVNLETLTTEHYMLGDNVFLLEDAFDEAGITFDTRGQKLEAMAELAFIGSTLRTKLYHYMKGDTEHLKDEAPRMSMHMVNEIMFILTETKIGKKGVEYTFKSTDKNNYNRVLKWDKDQGVYYYEGDKDKKAVDPRYVRVEAQYKHNPRYNEEIVKEMFRQIIGVPIGRIQFVEDKEELGGLGAGLLWTLLTAIIGEMFKTLNLQQVLKG